MDEKSILIEALLLSIRKDLQLRPMNDLRTATYILLKDTRLDDGGIEYGVTEDGRAAYRVWPGVVEQRQETFSLDD